MDFFDELKVEEDLYEEINSIIDEILGNYVSEKQKQRLFNFFFI